MNTDHSATLAVAARKIVHKTRGHKQGPITRLVSPSDIGQSIKPFVFLDFFEAESRFAGSMPIHPHSGIATVSLFTEGEPHFDDASSGEGTLAYGAVEWMRAGGGVWHGKEVSAGTLPNLQGFQLWIALPPELENAAVDSQYIEAHAMPVVGPAHVIVGRYQGVQSPVRAPPGINYLLVTIKSGQSWRYSPPPGHDVAWLAVAKGKVNSGGWIESREFAMFEQGNDAIDLLAGESEDAVFVIGSAVRHPHDLVMGHHSVHTSKDALLKGEAKIAEIASRMKSEGVFEREGRLKVMN